MVDFPATITCHLDEELSLGQLVQAWNDSHGIFGTGKFVRSVGSNVGNFLVKKLVFDEYCQISIFLLKINVKNSFLPCKNDRWTLKHSESSATIPTVFWIF